MSSRRSEGTTERTTTHTEKPRGSDFLYCPSMAQSKAHSHTNGTISSFFSKDLCKLAFQFCDLIFSQMLKEIPQYSQFSTRTRFDEYPYKKNKEKIRILDFIQYTNHFTYTFNVHIFCFMSVPFHYGEEMYKFSTTTHVLSSFSIVRLLCT